ncbi:Retrovirus-related Pol Polyprotein from transposon 301 [Phytophthora megakarya]|uniref:Retrovirus-related Pol Polyprotein from transposon 301 n=1 Tax=Phytophthora megakarya TaxID=4795 RepID=A0A225WFG9_9STRA|nr:Retrovirus-related Pol Polyprotein from transposon 301 [Phytophthora megakarya]
MIDYRPVNVLTVPIADTGAELTSSTENVDGAYGFAGFDMPSGFSQLPLDDDSQEIMIFIANDGVWTPCRVQQGAAAVPLHFQNQMNVAFAGMLYSELLIWIDDIPPYARTPRDFVGILRQFLIRVRERRLKLSVVKRFIFRKEAKWFGRIFSGTDISHDAERQWTS